MTWIKTIPYEKATGKLKSLYERIKGPDNNVDNIMLAHGLRPHTMEGHMSLYKYVLHHPHNTIPKWFLEVIGIYTSMLNKCHYCIEHHYQGMARLVGDDDQSQAYRDAMQNHHTELAFDTRQSAALAYTRKLTLKATTVTEDDIQTLRQAGWEDGEILEINQVTAYFNFANRVVLGLGINSGGDILGLSPNNEADPDDWQHH